MARKFVFTKHAINRARERLLIGEQWLLKELLKQARPLQKTERKTLLGKYKTDPRVVYWVVAEEAGTFVFPCFIVQPGKYKVVTCYFVPA